MNALDKEEFRIKLEEINKLVQDKDYKRCHEHCRQHRLETRQKMSAPYVLSVKIYAANGRYEDSKEIFLLAYHKASIGKNILYRLIEISLRMDDINEAEEFLKSISRWLRMTVHNIFCSTRLQGQKNSSLMSRSESWKSIKNRNLQRNGHMNWQPCITKLEKNRKCLDLCNEIILWFSEGKYVMKAYDLKMRMGELTGAEKAKFEKQFVPKLLTPEQDERTGEEKNGNRSKSAGRA